MGFSQEGTRLAKRIYDLIEANKRDEAIAVAETELVKVMEEN